MEISTLRFNDTNSRVLRYWEYCTYHTWFIYIVYLGVCVIHVYYISIKISLCVIYVITYKSRNAEKYHTTSRNRLLIPIRHPTLYNRCKDVVEIYFVSSRLRWWVVWGLYISFCNKSCSEPTNYWLSLIFKMGTYNRLNAGGTYNRLYRTWIICTWPDLSNFEGLSCSGLVYLFPNLISRTRRYRAFWMCLCHRAFPFLRRYAFACSRFPPGSDAHLPILTSGAAPARA